MCEGTREDGSVIEPNDPNWDALNDAARRARHDPQVWLREAGIYGDLADDPRFAAPFAQALTALWSKGCRATLRRHAGG
jgi:mannitol 2-dehydrogenase